MTSTTGWRAPAATNSLWRCPASPQPTASQVVAQRVQLALARPFVFAQQEIPLSATIGVSMYPGDAAERRSADQECRRRNASRQEGRPRTAGILQEIDQHARRQAPVHGGRFAQGAGTQRVHAELSAPAGRRGYARGSSRGFAALVASAARLCLARRVHPAGGAERPDRRDRRLGAARSLRPGAPLARRRRMSLAGRSECLGRAVSRRHSGRSACRAPSMPPGSSRA